MIKLLLGQRWLGRRGAFLMLFGLAYALSGYGRLRGGPPENIEGIRSLLVIAPFRTWAGFWLLCGLLAVAASFLRRPGADSFGFVALVTPTALWGMSNLAAYFTGYKYGLLGAGIYLALILAIVIVAGWPEPPPRNDGDGS